MELETLINGCKKKDIRCQEKLFKMYYGKLMGIAIRMTPNREIAKEVVQESFIKIFKKIDSLKTYEPAQIYTWCKLIVRNTAIDYYRKIKRNEKSFDDTFDSYDASDEINYNDYLDYKNISPNKVITAIQNLPPKMGLVFNLFVIDGLSHVEISEKLNINEGTSKSNLAKARMKLVKELTT